MPDKIHLTVATVVVRQNQYLMVKEFDSGKLVINQPAGHVEPGEDIIDAAIRETYEETGWHVDINGFIGVYSSKSPATGVTYYRLAFSAAVVSEDKHATIDTDIQQVLWLSAEQIRKNSKQLRSDLVIECLNDFECGEIYPLEIFRSRL
ncbi:MAG: NUDIX hydrolase [Porticoccaceae bacterium]